MKELSSSTANILKAKNYAFISSKISNFEFLIDVACCWL